MSRRLVYECAMSMHQLLIADPVARDVLCRMADRAHAAHRGDIIATLENLAEMCGRTRAVVRGAQERLLKAGLLVDRGPGAFNKRVRVFAIDENVLIDSPRLEMSEEEEDSTTRNDSGSGMLPVASTVSPSCADRDPIVRPSCADREPIVRPTRARVLNGEPRTENGEQGVTNAGAGAREVDPSATAEATASEARVQAAIEALLPDLREYHHAKAGSTASGRIVAGWRTKLATRLADDGKSAERIEARVMGIRAVLRWWRLPIEAAAQPGEPFCFYQTDLRSIAKLLDTANHLDKLVGWAADPRRKGATGWGNQPAPVRRTRGGVELGPPRFEFDTNPDGSVRW
jgi:hypothetical protein